MKQTKLESFIEACVNTALGYLISLLVWLFIVSPLFGIPVALTESILITGIFTVSSIARSYIVRRCFNAELHKIVHAIVGRLYRG